jgi:hypothetical protein
MYVRWTERAVLVVVVRQSRGQVLAACCSREVPVYLRRCSLSIDGFAVARSRRRDVCSCAAVRRWSAMPQLIARRDWRQEARSGKAGLGG